FSYRWFAHVRFGRIDLVWANCYWAKRPDTVQCSRAVKSGATNTLSQHPYSLRSWQKFYPFSMR
ncbi:unnamed protein product, partial [Porites evermanni]